MTKDQLKDIGRTVAACLDKARVARQRASDLDTTAAQYLDQAEQHCKAAGLSFKHWVKRNTGLTYKQADAFVRQIRWAATLANYHARRSH
jgi:hypothetical protein